MTTQIWVNIGSGKGLVPWNEPMLTFHLSGFVAFTSGSYDRKCARHLTFTRIWKLLISYFYRIQGPICQEILVKPASRWNREMKQGQKFSPFVWRCLWCPLTHWGHVTPICVSNLTIIGSDNGLSPDRRQVITWTNGGILLIGPLRTNLNKI